MKAFRLVNSVFADLDPIGISGRWNKEKDFVLYASQSISLSCLEILAHIEHFPAGVSYSLIQFEISDRQITKPDLKHGWKENEEYTRMIGAEWYKEKRTLALLVPSIIVNSEYNFVINSRHPDFIKLFEKRIVKPFSFDKRLFR